jgi:Cytoskeletal-regulatory complex EF hand
MYLVFRCLADIDVDGNLSPDEFCVAMYLIDMAKLGQPIPTVLPPGIVPPAYRRLRRASESTSNITPPTVVTGESYNVFNISYLKLCSCVVTFRLPQYVEKRAWKY